MRLTTLQAICQTLRYSINNRGLYRTALLNARNIGSFVTEGKDLERGCSARVRLANAIRDRRMAWDIVVSNDYTV